MRGRAPSTGRGGEEVFELSDPSGPAARRPVWGQEGARRGAGRMLGVAIESSFVSIRPPTCRSGAAAQRVSEEALQVSRMRTNCCTARSSSETPHAMHWHFWKQSAAVITAAAGRERSPWRARAFGYWVLRASGRSSGRQRDPVALSDGGTRGAVLISHGPSKLQIPVNPQRPCARLRVSLPGL